MIEKQIIINAKRSLLDRFIRHVRPKVVSAFAPPPVRIASDLWSLERRLRMPGGPILPTRTTVIRLRPEAILVVSPPPVEAGGLENLDTLGAVEQVLVPNSFYDLSVPGFVGRYPQATLRLARIIHQRKENGGKLHKRTPREPRI